MPTYLTLETSASDDLNALRKFVYQKQNNWECVARNFRFIQEQYAAYEADFEQCEIYPSLQPYGTHAARLTGLYDQRPACFSYIKELRKKANIQLSVCPYCGMPGRLTLDHYLPRAKGAFPHFSVFKRNLVPACDACQSAKGAFVPNYKRPFYRRSQSERIRRCRQRSFRNRIARKKLTMSAPKTRTNFKHSPNRLLHPYFDAFLVRPVWRLAYTDGNRPLESLNLVPFTQSIQCSKMVQFHIRKLGLLERAPRAIRHWIRYAARFLQESEIRDVEAARHALLSLARSARDRDKTPNSIASVTLSAIRADTDLIEAVLQRANGNAPMLTVRSQGVRL